MASASKPRSQRPRRDSFSPPAAVAKSADVGRKPEILKSPPIGPLVEFLRRALFCLGCFVSMYGWMRIRTFKTWRDLGIGVAIGLGGFVIGFIGGVLLLSWDKDRVERPF